MNKQQLASKIWESANKMRSKIEANEYKDYILGFIFYKFLSDKELEYLYKEGWTKEDLIHLKEEDEETKESIRKNIGYYISHENLFSTWLEKGKDFDVKDVRDALSAFSRLINKTHEKVFTKIFDTLQTGLSKLGDSSSSQTKAISGLLDLIKDIPMDGKQDYDVLGFIYEYLISMFAANAGKKAGEFYTPHEVSLLMSEIVASHLKDKEEIEIYDPTSGSGSLLINIGNSVAKHMKDRNKIKYFAQELKENTYNLTRMNLVMRGILPDNIYTRCGDTLEEDWPYFDENDRERTYTPLYVDAVVSNPPYSQSWEPTDRDSDPRYKRFGLAPKTKADYAFLLHDLYHIKPHGIMTIVLPHGVLFRGGEEENIRKNLIENNHIDAVIGLPANIFFGTGIPTIVMVLKQKRDNTDILIVDGSKGYIKVGKNNKLQASDIKKIVDAVENRETIEKFSRVVSRNEIRENGYNLNIPRYVDSSEKAESWDIFATMFGGIPNKEINGLDKCWSSFGTLKQELFAPKNAEYSNLLREDTQKAIEDNAEIQNFAKEYNTKFEGFNTYLVEECIKKMSEIKINKAKQVIAENIFSRLEGVSLVDKYKAYQMLDDSWKTIGTDLEIIQSEGEEVLTKVIPNMVTKKKDGKEYEVQDGFVGYIIPFDLVQSTILQAELIPITQKEARQSEISTDIEEVFESLTEDDKGKAFVNEDGTEFVAKEITKKAKEIRKAKLRIEPDSIESKVLKVDSLLEEDKKLKKEIRALKDALHKKTKETIEKLTRAEVETLLEEKWINPLCTQIASIPTQIIAELSAEVKKLAEKYKETLTELDEQIATTEKEFADMIDDLDGSEFDLSGLASLQKMLRGE